MQVAKPPCSRPWSSLIDFGQHLGGLGRELRQGADGADDERYGHCGLKSFAADVAQDDEGRALLCAFERNDLEEVAPNFLGWTIRARKGETGDGGQGFRNQDLL